MRSSTSRKLAIAALAVLGLAVAALARLGTAHAQQSISPLDEFCDERLRRLAYARPGEHVPGLLRQDGGGPHEFYFTRGMYTSGFGRGGWRRNAWATDFPKADRQFMYGLTRLADIDAYPCENPLRLDDPELRRYPFLYMLEVGSISLTESEMEGLRSYLLAGGFVMIDDFWGSFQWSVFEEQMRRLLPEYPIVELSLDHPLFRSYYEITEILQVPAVNRARWGGPTSEGDGIVPHARGIFDENGRLMVVINWNTDLGDAWEWAEDPYYPLRFSTFAYQMGLNTIIYAMSH